MISNDEAIAKFKEIIGSKEGWQYLKESQFINHMTVFLSWALRNAQYGTERAIQEYFLSTALNRSSIMAHAEDRGYVPRKSVPSTGEIAITNSGDSPVAIPANQQFKSNHDLDYIVFDAVDIQPHETVTAEISQLLRKVITHTVIEAKPYYEILFDMALSETISGINVWVDIDDGNGSVPWQLARLFQNTTPVSTVYDEFFTHQGQYGIRFGNDEFGKIVPHGAVVTIVLLMSEGDTILVKGQRLSAVGDVVDSNGDIAVIDIICSDQIDGGTAAESMEELRKNLQYWPLYQDQLVWKEDFEFFIRRRFPDILWMNVWGEKEAESAAGGFSVEFINTIFISAYAEDYATLQEDIMDALEAVGLINRRFQWVTPAIYTFSVFVTGVVESNVSAIAATSIIESALETNYGINSRTRKTDVLIKDIYSIIESTGVFSSGGSYTVSLSGKSAPSGLNEIIAINMDSTTISLSNK